MIGVKGFGEGGKYDKEEVSCSMKKIAIVDVMTGLGIGNESSKEIDDCFEVFSERSTDRADCFNLL